MTSKPSELHAMAVDSTKLFQEDGELYHGFTFSLHQAALHVVAGPHTGMRLSLEREQQHIGRSAWCDLCLADDDWISAEHCLVLLDEGKVRIKDLGSTNGIFLEGHQVFDICLRIGGRLHLGNTVLELQTQNTPTDIDVSYVDPSGSLLGRSPAMRRLFAMLPRVAPRHDVSVLLLGETGTGKSLMAHAIHTLSGRNGALVTIDCSTLRPELLGSELFGHEKGAFTGAHSSHSGLLEAAEGGTLFLDEVGELSLDMQRQLLRVLETRLYRRVGGKAERKADFRLLCATNRDVQKEVTQGCFREDLYYRLAAVVLRLPPLRERREDLPLLCKCLLSAIAPEEGLRLDAKVLDRLQGHLWPGNIRELRNVLLQASLFAEGSVIKRADLEESSFWSALLHDTPSTQTDLTPPPASRDGTVSQVACFDEGEAGYLSLGSARENQQLSLKEALDNVTRTLLEQALRDTDGNVQAAAESLGISRGWCFTLVKRHGLK